MLATQIRMATKFLQQKDLTIVYKKRDFEIERYTSYKKLHKNAYCTHIESLKNFSYTIWNKKKIAC